MKQHQGFFTDALMPWLPVAGALLVNAKVLGGGLLYDDFVHLFAVTDLPFLEAINHSGTQHLLQSYKLAVWTLNALFGANPLPFFLLVLALHLVNVRLLYEIIVRLAHNPTLAALVAGFWGMGPFAAGALAWISVHGQVYATSAVLWLFFDLVRLGESQLRVSGGLVARHTLLLLVAATSYGTGLVAAVVLPLVIALWGLRVQHSNRLVVAYVIAAVVILLFYLSMAESQGQSAKALNKLFQGDFSRALKQLDAVASLASIGFSGLLFGPFTIGKYTLVQGEWLVPVARQVGLYFAIPALLAGLLWSDARTRLRVVALLLLASALYGLIALARSGGMLPFKPEALRYHYLAAAPIAILFSLVIAVLLTRWSPDAFKWARPVFATGLLFAIYPFHLASLPAVENFHTAGQAAQYKQALAALEAALTEESGQSPIYIPNEPFKVFAWKYTPEHFPGLAGVFVISYPDNTVNGRRVYFVEDSREVVEMYQGREGTRISELLVHAPGSPGSL